MLHMFTDEEYAIGKQNGITRKTMHRRYRRGWMKTECYMKGLNQKKDTGGRKFSGRFLSDGQIQTAYKNGVGDSVLYNRLSTAWSIDAAIHTPLKKTRPKQEDSNENFSPEYLKECIARIKQINAHETQFPITVPKPMIEKMKRLGIEYDDIEPKEG